MTSHMKSELKERRIMQIPAILPLLQPGLTIKQPVKFLRRNTTKRGARSVYPCLLRLSARSGLQGVVRFAHTSSGRSRLPLPVSHPVTGIAIQSSAVLTRTLGVLLRRPWGAALGFPTSGLCVKRMIHQ